MQLSATSDSAVYFPHLAKSFWKGPSLNHVTSDQKNSSCELSTLVVLVLWLKRCTSNFHLTECLQLKNISIAAWTASTLFGIQRHKMFPLLRISYPQVSYPQNFLSVRSFGFLFWLGIPRGLKMLQFPESSIFLTALFSLQTTKCQHACKSKAHIAYKHSSCRYRCLNICWSSMVPLRSLPQQWAELDFLVHRT